MANRERHNEASELDHMGRSPDIEIMQHLVAETEAALSRAEDFR
jgi:hypothetical protein